MNQIKQTLMTKHYLNEIIVDIKNYYRNKHRLFK